MSTPSSQITRKAERHADSVVFFDGVCGLCNHSVNWLLARDPEHRLRFAPLQGQTAHALLSAEVRDRLDTLVFLRNGNIYIRTAAVSRILMALGGRWSLVGGLLWIIPSPLRNLGYRLVASLRYRLFGKHDACRLPTPAERAVFLD
jgi:predicted DCC family thiol-disulfide oxidoreductase YuxK